jgi:hypothetical protein
MNKKLIADKIKALKGKISEDALAAIMENPALIDVELQRREKYWPLKDFVPNVAQGRALSCYASRHETYQGGYPFIMIFRAGNGVGKTCSMTILLAGVSLGPNFLNKQYFNHRYFYECQEIRKKRRLKIRIVCDKADMQENGSVYQEISKWIPAAKFEGKTSGGYYTIIRIPAQSEGYRETVIDIKTFDMDIVAHAGPDYDLVVFNEPAPKDKYNENIGRCRKGGRVALFLTPLNQAEYLHQIENGDYPDGEVFVSEASIWDNCADITGNRGNLSRHDIERMIRQWNANNPLEVPARRDGKYMHLAGAIFGIFNKQVHVTHPFAIPPEYNIYKITDPHDAKPPFTVWIAVSPVGKCYVVAEYPVEPWDQIQGTFLTIRNFVDEFERIERGKHQNFQYIRKISPVEWLGDPNKFQCPDSNTRQTLKALYESYSSTGEMINTKINDDISVRHEKVRELLLYDHERKIDSMNCPKLFVFSSCKNVIRAFENYQYKNNTSSGLGEGWTGKIDQKWECPMACVGYFAVHFDGYQPFTSNKNSHYDDYYEIDKGRHSKEYEDEESYFEPNRISCGERFV